MPKRFDGISQNTRPSTKVQDGIPDRGGSNPTEESAEAPAEEKSLKDINESVDATPGARNLATENKVNLKTTGIQGSGEGGRIWLEDVEKFLENRPSS